MVSEKLFYITKQGINTILFSLFGKGWLIDISLILSPFLDDSANVEKTGIPVAYGTCYLRSQVRQVTNENLLRKFFTGKHYKNRQQSDSIKK
jgi:hypothetical protein